MKIINHEQIVTAVAELCEHCACVLETAADSCLRAAVDSEPTQKAKETLGLILENAELAAEQSWPICQDTGMVLVFSQIGNEVIIYGATLNEAVNAGVRLGYRTLRKSVSDPLTRENTRDNTPAVIYTEQVHGDTLKLSLMLKGAGSENMSRLFMLKPVDGLPGIEECVLTAVKEAGPNPCPPIVVGVGIGGTADYSAVLAKKSLLRATGDHASNPVVAELEHRLLDKINDLGIGPAGFGGRTTALAVHIETAPTHIACLPVSVCIQCHAVRHGEVIL